MSNNNPAKSPENLKNHENAHSASLDLNFSQNFNQEFNDFFKNSRDHIVDLEKFLANPENAVQLKGIFSDLLRKKMQESLHGKVTAKEIQEKIDADLEKNLIFSGSSLALQYQSLQVCAQKSAEKWFEIEGSNQRTLKMAIEKLSFEELRSAINSPQKMKEKLAPHVPNVQNFFSPRRISNSLVNDLPIRTENMSDEEFDKFCDEIAVYVNTGQPSRELLSMIFSFAEKTHWDDRERIGNFLKEVMPLISLENLEKIGAFSPETQKAIFAALSKSYEDRIWSAYLPEGFESDPQEIDENSEAYKAFLSVDRANTFVEISAIFDEQCFVDIVAKNQKTIDLFAEIVEEEFEKQKIFEEKNTPKIETIEEMHQKLQQKIENLSPEIRAKISQSPQDFVNNFREGNYFIICDTDGKKGVFSLGNTSEHTSEKRGLLLYPLSVDENISSWKKKTPLFFSYDECIDLLINRLSGDDIVEMSTMVEEPLLPENREVFGLNSWQDFCESLNEIDEDGANHPFEPGAMFTLKIDNKIEFATLHSFNESGDPKTLTICGFDGQKVTVSWEHFLEITDWNIPLRRIGKIETPQEFAQNAVSIDKSSKKPLLFQNLEWNSHHSEIFVKNDNSEAKPLWGFSDDSRNTFAEIRFKNGAVDVTLTEFKRRGDIPEAKVDVDKNANKNTKDAQNAKNEEYIRSIKNFKNISYAQLLQILHEKSLDQTESLGKKDEKKSKTPIEERENEIRAREGENMSGADISRLKVYTIGDLVYMFKSGKELIKKKLEHRSSVKTAYSMINGPHKQLRLYGRELFSRVVEATIEDTKKKYAGAQMRRHILGILKDDSAKPHEVLAALIIVYEMGGTLYPDSYLSNLQGRKYVWFEKVARALGLDPQVQLKLAMSKVYKSNAEEYTLDRLPEEELIKRMFKMNQETNEYLQAMSGGARIWKIADRQRKEQVSKGETEVVDEATSAIARADYAVKKMESNEFEIALGAMSKVFSAGMGKDEMGIIFTMTMGGAPGYVHPSVMKQFQGQIFSGFAFHAFHFCKNKSGSDLYFDAVNLAVKYSQDSAMQQAFAKVLAHKPKDPFAHNGDYYAELWKFWKQYNGSLHEILQGTNPVLQAQAQKENTPANERQTIIQYFKKLGANDGWKEWILKNSGVCKDQIENGAYNKGESPYYLSPSEDKPLYRSLALPLAPMDIKDDYSMSGRYREDIFRPQVLGYLDQIRNNPGFVNNPDFQKEQLRISYKEIMYKLHEKTFPYYEGASMTDEERRETYAKTMDTRLKHLKMLTKYGFDVSYDTMKDQKNIDAAFERVYANFVSGTNSHQSDILQKKIKEKYELTFTGDGNQEKSFEKSA